MQEVIMASRKSKTRTRPATRCPSPFTITDPTPLELDRYIPWLFMKEQSAQNVVIKKVYQEELPRARNTRFTSSSRISRVSTAVSIRQADSYPSLELKAPTTTSLTDSENVIQLTIVYSRAGHAVEIAITRCPFPINRKLIEAISLVLPYHSRLNKFTCKGKCLNCRAIDDVAKMLPFSNLTDICLDNSFVPQANYYNLLDQTSTLKCLSLSKCKINDIVCKKIAERLGCNGIASKNLRILSLCCNLITDIGAQALGHSLRTNRRIMHLNLCGNSITTMGAGYLLEPLSEFSLTPDEIKEMVSRRREFYSKKATFPKSPTSTFTSFSSENGKNQKDRESLQNKYLTDSKANVVYTDKEAVEDFSDPSNTIYENGRWFSIGNLILCSLNLAYNNLDYTCLSKIVDVLSYQKDRDRATRCTGLLRIVVEGNNLPVGCEEYSKIEMLLGTLHDRAWSYKQKRKSSSSKTRRNTSSRIASSSVLLMP